MNAKDFFQPWIVMLSELYVVCTVAFFVVLSNLALFNNIKSWNDLTYIINDHKNDFNRMNTSRTVNNLYCETHKILGIQGI